jgi:hypothetical protein
MSAETSKFFIPIPFLCCVKRPLSKHLLELTGTLTHELRFSFLFDTLYCNIELDQYLPLWLYIQTLCKAGLKIQIVIIKIRVKNISYY